MQLHPIKVCILFVLVYLGKGTKITVLKKKELVIHGISAHNKQFPWMLALFYKNQFVCSATIISQRAVLTTGHCIVINGVYQSPEGFSGIIGDVNKDAKGIRVTFSNITPHPGHDNLINDLAILTTTEEIKFNDFIQPICLAVSDFGPMTLKEFKTMGWGITARYAETFITPSILQFTHVRVYPRDKCAKLYHVQKVPDTIICAGELNTGICFGDSGGPLVTKIFSTQYAEVGVATFVNVIHGCGRINSPAGYTSVRHYRDFISRTAKGDLCYV